MKDVGYEKVAEFAETTHWTTAINFNQYPKTPNLKPQTYNFKLI